MHIHCEKLCLHSFVKKLIVFAPEHGIAQVFCINRPAADFGEVLTQAVFAKDT